MTTTLSDSPNAAPRCLTNTLDHLPEPKRLQLRTITERLCAAVALDWVVLFGSYARGREKLESFCGAEAVGVLPAVPEDGEAPELPPLPEVEDRAAMEQWGRLVAEERWESGVAEGEVRRASNIALALLEEGMAVEQVARVTGLAMEEIVALGEKR
ncbi:hypothetical protein [Endothiovibrio diazotrophicus]